MKAGFNSRRLFGITRSKGKMYEFGLDESQHLRVPEGSDPLQLFVMTIATLGDVTGVLAELPHPLTPLPPESQAELNFCASFFDAVLDSGFAQGLERTTLLLASAAYYVARRPGSSLVLARRLVPKEGGNKVEHFLQWLLKADWRTYWTLDDERYGPLLTSLSFAIASHFADGSRLEEIDQLLKQLRNMVYKTGSPEEVLYADVALSVCRMKLAASAWVTLPSYSGLSVEHWRQVIQRGRFPKRTLAFSTSFRCSRDIQRGIGLGSDAHKCRKNEIDRNSPAKCVHVRTHETCGGCSSISGTLPRNSLISASGPSRQ